jgi:hypothetical protein
MLVLKWVKIKGSLREFGISHKKFAGNTNNIAVTVSEICYTLELP